MIELGDPALSDRRKLGLLERKNRLTLNTFPACQNPPLVWADWNWSNESMGLWENIVRTPIGGLMEVIDRVNPKISRVLCTMFCFGVAAFGERTSASERPGFPVDP